MIKQKIEWTTDADGQLQLGGIHDSNLLELHFKKGFLSFRIKGATESVLQFELGGLRELKLGLWDGAIIDDLSIWKVDAVPEKLLEYGDVGWNLLFKDRISDLPRVVKQADKIIKLYPSAYLFQVECSYGENIVAICDTFSIYSESED